jgi:hypothetical protein
MMDYCTLFPEGWWAHCCQIHDNDYAAQAGQALADERLWQCVANSADGTFVGTASIIVASVMWCGVRVFGRRYYRKAGEEGRSTV